MLLIAILAGAVALAAWIWHRTAAEERRWCEVLPKVAEDADADVHYSFIGESREARRG